jgi:hypothetical protein
LYKNLTPEIATSLSNGELVSALRGRVTGAILAFENNRPDMLAELCVVQSLSEIVVT